MKKFSLLFLLAVTGIFTLVGCSKSSSGKNGDVYVYNWGEYIDPKVADLFEKETGIKVHYDTFVTNEDMYPKVKAGAVEYDLICPSDYMIQRMIDENLLSKIDFNNVPNLKNIDPTYLDKSKSFDPTNEYSVPYCWGTVGILYNKTKVDGPIDSWSVLFDEKYKDKILMINSVRDALGIALKYLGYSINTTNKDEIEEATQLLIKQKSLVQGYFVDEVRDKMIGDDAAISVIYSGEANFTKRENKNLEYVVPKEGSNVWIDSWVIPKNCKNKKNAEIFLNFLCRDDIAKMNFDYITYSTPNKAAKSLLDEETQNNKVAFPDASILDNCETFNYLGDKMETFYANQWKEVKSH